MGQNLSCGVARIEREFIAAVHSGELKVVEAILHLDPEILRRSTLNGDLTALHIAAAMGHHELLSLLLERWAHSNVLSRQKRTPLMLAAIGGKITCVEKLLRAGANILMFDSAHGRTCVHYAAYYGQSDCLQAILQTAHTSPITESWGFARLVNVRDAHGETALHLAAKRGQLDCIRLLLDKGALVCASSGYYGFRGNAPLHLAARQGSMECVRELLAWGADRLQMDSAGRTAYTIAIMRNHLCAPLLNPSSAELLVWPSPLKFFSELNSDVKLLLENAFMEVNRKRDKRIFKGTVYSLPSPAHSESFDDDKLECNSMELCSICFEQACTIEVQECGHQMCAHCTVALCCRNKPKQGTQPPPAPTCPFCRRDIARLTVTKKNM